jgi:2-polyprenyl-3-methyl-5-hydroxy-6-metoxy-1,4-benzoquinol methylase
MIENKFFKKDDINFGVLGEFKIPPSWWSRGYEYAFVSKYVKKTDVIMDAGCGIEHPFKWWAGDNTKMVYAVDVDPRLHEYPAEDHIEWWCCDFDHFAKQFKGEVDKIFCISVLEHISNPANVIVSLSKVLKKKGKMILTIDYPLLRPQTLLQIIEPLSLSIGEYEYEEGPNDVVGPGGLRVYSAVLTKE